MYSYYVQTINNDKEEIINNIFSKYAEPLLDGINNPALVQECKINLDASLYEKQLDDKVDRTSDKK